MANGLFSKSLADSTKLGKVIPIDLPEEFPLSVLTLEIVKEYSEGVYSGPAALIVVEDCRVFVSAIVEKIEE